MVQNTDAKSSFGKGVWNTGHSTLRKDKNTYNKKSKPFQHLVGIGS